MCSSALSMMLFLVQILTIVIGERTVNDFQTPYPLQHHRLSVSIRKRGTELYSERVPSIIDAALLEQSDRNPSNSTTDMASSSSVSVGDAILRLGGIDTSSNTPTVWAEFSRLATEFPVTANLGHGWLSRLATPTVVCHHRCSTGSESRTRQHSQVYPPRRTDIPHSSHNCWPGGIHTMHWRTILLTATTTTTTAAFTPLIRCGI